MAKEIPYFKFFTGEYLSGVNNVTKCKPYYAVLWR